nr:MAG: hypothetical protein DIU57_17650 [Pseudomonadota bacterium]
MAAYYVNRLAQTNGDHEVHRDGCAYMPQHRIYLGQFTNCWQAVFEARKYFSQCNGCYWCSRECHTS